MPNYSTKNLPSNKAINHLVNIDAGGGWGRSVSKADRAMLVRNDLVTHEGLLTQRGRMILMHVSTPLLPTPKFNKYRRVINTQHIGWSSDSTIWFYKDTAYEFYGQILWCLAIDFGLCMFGIPTDQR